MSVSATVVVLEDGPRNLVVHLYAEIGGGDQEYNVKKIDVTTLSKLTNTPQACTHLALEKFQGSTQNLTVHLAWEGSPNTRIWTIPANFMGHQDFRKTAPIQNNATSRTGNVLLSTVNDGDPPLDGRYDILVYFRKKFE